MEVPIREVVLEDFPGLEFFSLVDKPAYKWKWVAFSEEEEPLKFTVSEEKQMIAGPAIVADQPVKRIDPKTKKPFYLVFRADVIRAAFEKFSREGKMNNVNIMHSSAKPKPGTVYMTECFIIDRARGINPPKGFENLTDGSLWIGHKIDDKILFNQCKEDFQGYSLQGFFDWRDTQTEDEKQVEDLIDILTQYKKVI